MTRSEASHVHLGKAALLVVATLFLAMAWTIFYSTPAGAEADPYSSKTPNVLPTRIIQPADDDPPATTTLKKRNELPITGGDVVLFVAIGAAAVGTGLVLVRRARNHG